MNLNIAVTALCAWMGPLGARAEDALIYSVDFNAATGAAVEGVTGGSATLMFNDENPAHLPVIQTEPEMGSGGFLHVDQVGVAGGGIMVTPGDETHSLGALTTKPGDHWVVNGGLDFFFRNSSAPPNVIDQKNELQIFFQSGQDGGLNLAVANSTTSFGIRISGQGIAEAFETTNKPELNEFELNAPEEFHIEDNVTYHLGLTFSTDEAGVTTVRLFGKPGIEAIETGEGSSDLLASAAFDLNEKFVNSGFKSGPYLFGIYHGAGNPKAQDFDSFRLYKADPGTFPALQTPAAPAK